MKKELKRIKILQIISKILSNSKKDMLKMKKNY